MSDFGSVGLDEIVGALEEIVGDEDFDESYFEDLVSGEDDDEEDDDDDDDDDDEVEGEEVGARRRRRRRRRRRSRRNKLARAARMMKRLRNIDPNAVMVKSQVDRVRRRLMLPTDPLVLAASASDTLEIKPQRLFRTELIIVPSDIASNFIITDIKIGQASQLVGAGSIPAMAFSEASVNAFLHLDSANVGNTMTMDVTNLDAANPQTFRALLLGTATVR